MAAATKNRNFFKAAILVGSREHRTQFWKGAIQESFQQSLVEIGSVVSEEKIFSKFHPPFFIICIIGQNWQQFKDHKKCLTYIPDFSVKFFFQPIYTDYAN
jgi:UV DNA damage repair endonuclease